MAKITRNKMRDAEVRESLAAAGWTVMVLWECETENAVKVQEVAQLIKTVPRRLRPLAKGVTQR